MVTLFTGHSPRTPFLTNKLFMSSVWLNNPFPNTLLSNKQANITCTYLDQTRTAILYSLTKRGLGSFVMQVFSKPFTRTLEWVLWHAILCDNVCQILFTIWWKQSYPMTYFSVRFGVSKKLLLQEFCVCFVTVSYITSAT